MWFPLSCYMLKSHQRGDLTPAETKVYYLRFAKVLYEEINGFKRLAANGGTLLSRSYFLKERSLQKRRLTKLLEWVNNWTIHGSASSLLCPFSYQGKVNILENEWIRRRDLPIFRRSQGHNDRQQGRMFSQSSRSCVQEFEQCHKRSNFWKIAVSLSRNHSTSC